MDGTEARCHWCGFVICGTPVYGEARYCGESCKADDPLRSAMTAKEAFDAALPHFPDEVVATFEDAVAGFGPSVTLSIGEERSRMSMPWTANPAAWIRKVVRTARDRVLPLAYECPPGGDSTEPAMLTKVQLVLKQGAPRDVYLLGVRGDVALIATKLSPTTLVPLGLHHVPLARLAGVPGREESPCSG